MYLLEYFAIPKCTIARHLRFTSGQLKGFAYPEANKTTLGGRHLGHASGKCDGFAYYKANKITVSGGPQSTHSCIF